MPYSPVYSSQFIVYTDSTPNQNFDVPDGNTAVIRDFTAFATVAATFAQVQIADGPGAVYCTVAQLELASINVYEQWTGRVVVPGGGSIRLVLGSLTAGASCYVGGYLLKNVAP